MKTLIELNPDQIKEEYMNLLHEYMVWKSAGGAGKQKVDGVEITPEFLVTHLQKQRGCLNKYIALGNSKENITHAVDQLRQVDEEIAMITSVEAKPSDMSGFVELDRIIKSYK
jgi:hypothetical protein